VHNNELSRAKVVTNIRTLQRLVAKAITARAGDVSTYVSPQHDTELPAERFKFNERVDSFNNLQILEKAARLVYQGQTVSTC
jgi:hypothetical protein